MRANEFINEGWYDDAKAKVKSATAPALNRMSSAGGAMKRGIGNAANTVKQGVKSAVSDFQQTNAAHAATHDPKTNPIQAPNTAVGAASGNFINQDLKPALAQVGSAWRQGVNTFKQGAIDREASKSFAKKFLQQIEYNRQAAQRQGVEFNLAGFVNGYMTKYHWKPGALKPQLDKAIASNDLYNLPKVMAQIGKANTAIQGGPEIQGSFGTNAQQAAAATTPATAAAPAQKQQVSKAAKQINNTIPRLNKTDVASVKQTADATYARKAASTMPQTGTVH